MNAETYIKIINWLDNQKRRAFIMAQETNTTPDGVGPFARGYRLAYEEIEIYFNNIAKEL